MKMRLPKHINPWLSFYYNRLCSPLETRQRDKIDLIHRKDLLNQRFYEDAPTWTQPPIFAFPPCNTVCWMLKCQFVSTQYVIIEVFIFLLFLTLE